MMTNKEAIVEELLNLKAKKDLVESRMKDLKAQINPGEKIVTERGFVSCHEQNRTTYDEKAIYEAMLDQGIDPTVLGEVVVKIDRKKVKTASGELIEPHIKVTTSNVVRIEPTEVVRNKVAKQLG